MGETNKLLTEEEKQAIDLILTQDIVLEKVSTKYLQKY